MIELKKLVDAGVHFGHQTWRWNPKMKPYIWGSKNNIHLINVAKTALQMEKAAKFINQIAAEGKSILWVGTKKPAQKIVRKIAESIDTPYVVHRWIGGTLTNSSQVKKSVTKMLYYEDILAKADKFRHTKKELGVFQKMLDRYEKSIGGIRKLNWPVGALVLVDAKKELTAVKEAIAAGVPTIALVDTNSDPSLIDYPIPANDDIPSSIEIILSFLSDAAKQGQEVAKKAKEKEKATRKIESSKAVAKKEIELLEERVKTEKRPAKKVVKKAEEKPVKKS